MKRSYKETLRRYASFVVVLFIIAFGTSLSIRANLGSSPISCPPYVLSLVPGAWSMGSYVMCMHVFFILAQIALLRKDYQKIQLLQILVSVLFGVYTDVTMWMTSFLQVPDTVTPVLAYTLRFIELLIGGGILAYGISLEVHCDVLMLAGEGFPLAIAKVVKKDFGKVKMFSDTGLVCAGVIFMFIFFGSWHWDMIGPGTLVSMFYVGYMVRKFSPTMGWFDKLLTDKPATATATDNIQQTEEPLVITISREYGSGGHDVGRKLASELGVAFYDRTLIDKTAAQLGYATEYVAEKEQNLSTSKLWELIFTDKSIPESMNPSHDDAIFVTQSRTIRELADKPCVLIGRMADWVLRDRKNCLKVFITSEHDFAVNNIMAKDNMTADAAARKIERVNKGRSNHYYQYSGRHWTDARNYDLVINVSHTGIDGAVELIEQMIKYN